MRGSVCDRLACLTAATMTLAISAGVAWAEEPPVDPYYTRQAIEAPMGDGKIERFHVTSLGRVIEGQGTIANPELGSCPITVTHTDSSFEGGSYTAQAGFAESEIAAATYTVPAAAFPIILKTAEMIFATSNATVTTTTKWSIMVWSGNPQTGTLVATYSSDGKILPNIIIPPGTNGVNVLFQIDPNDPEQIVINAPGDGSNSFTVGYRIDEHHDQTANPCFTAPSSNRNAFPTTDVSGLGSPTNNWLFGVNCGQFGCPSNGGWARFSQLNVLCRPSGDWVIRATYEPFSCAGLPGACCYGIGNCITQTLAQCTANGGQYGGDGSNCATFQCAFGACCLPDNSCEEVTATQCATLGGAYQGNGVTCVAASCSTLPRACCFPSTQACVNNISPSNCTNLNGVSGPPGSTCTNYICFPVGACCLFSGQCLDNQSPSQCTSMGGTFRGHQSTCAGVVCPIPDGACCVGVLGCIVIGQEDCELAIGGEYKGDGSNCNDGNGNSQPDVCEACDCPGDANGDCQTNGADLSVLLGQFNTNVSPGTGADYNSDGTVNGADLSVLLSNFGCS